MQQQGEAVKAWSENEDFGFFVREADFVHMPPMETDFQFPYLSVMAGMSPSPDWYTGFYSFWLIDEYSQTWYDHIKIQVRCLLSCPPPEATILFLFDCLKSYYSKMA